MNVLADMMRAKGIRSELPLRNTGAKCGSGKLDIVDASACRFAQRFRP